ncbi:MAG: 4Fe-4S ferredoxin, iron-sulpur binding containing [Candidatus Magnetoglobus multicellularis str. Araruama]|uniref:4Fe-4S ferredoxin, iron-sulpur binding containing n=1 Tax=Candidatus Magnetoglobus multicellularis str. Araruama TaxID=890399 RepID=A0A1V1PI27_9BACT|nr:MAG: 4Fe-4S ferredoxin, iron-sulpur binding containing [Candidatus Magnetoglobus multicellularis str. Araruama]
MYSKIVILNFPKTQVEKPLVCNLARHFDLSFNILNAEILPRKEGKMVIELLGTQKNCKKGVQYLKENGVRVKSAGSDIKRHEDICTHCGACTAVCPTNALSIRRPEMYVEFDRNKCSLCELCVRVCPSRAMYIRPTKNIFFGE